MNILATTNTFHLYNDRISYVMTILPTGDLGQLYCGARIPENRDYSYLLESSPRPMASYPFPENRMYSPEHLRREYAVYGSGDYRSPALEVLQENGSRISEFFYAGCEIDNGKPKLPGLPATYTESDDEAMTLTIHMADPVSGLQADFLYTIFRDEPAIARSVHFRNGGDETVHLTRAMSLCLDLPDSDYTWVQLSGAWARERHVKERHLTEGIQSVGSMRGHSSHEHNPFVILKRPGTDEMQGEALAFSLVYSGNFLAQAEADTHGTARMLMGIHPDCFDWKLEPGEEFQTPECVMFYTDRGLNSMSQSIHRLYGRRLAHGFWRDRPRPILLNNWEATYFDFTEDRLVEIATRAKDCGVELFVLDDGWFGKRTSDHAGLGDWVPNPDRLTRGISGLSERIEALGLKFGLWFEPEMVNKDSDLYRAHPDWILSAPGRNQSHGRYQYVLDFSRKEVVDEIYGMMYKILSTSKISYIKWDMNRSITECFSQALPADRQGEVFHRYILGVYDLYERLTTAFPQILFESCSSGGGRFDAGLLYYAPQGWASDCSDAVERLKIQHGTSMCYPISAIGSHVSVVPNHQLHRVTPLHTRANAAFFGTFGYELDLNKLTEEEQAEVRKQIGFMKEYRGLLQFGTFWRLASPFEGNITAWMVVSEDKRTAVLGWFRTLNVVNGPYTRLKLAGLDDNLEYRIELPFEEASEPGFRTGRELQTIGLITSDGGSGEVIGKIRPSCDFDSRLYVLKA